MRLNSQSKSAATITSRKNSHTDDFFSSFTKMRLEIKNYMAKPESKSKPMFEDMFDFKVRRNRKSFVYQYIGVFIVAIIPMLILNLIGIVSVGYMDTVAILLICQLTVFAIGITAAVIYIANATQRLRDIGYSGAWAAIILIPILNLAFWAFITFYAGQTNEKNIYGPSCICD